MLKIEEIFDLKFTKYADIFEGVEYPWEILSRLEEYIKAKIKPGTVLGKKCALFPLKSVAGVFGVGSLVK